MKLTSTPCISVIVGISEIVGISVIVGSLCLAGASIAQEPDEEAYAAAKAARHEGAKRLLERLTLSIQSGNLQGAQLAQALRDRGVAYNYVGDYTKALEDFSHAIELDLVNPQYYEDRAIVYLKLRDYARAGTDLDMVLGLDSKRATAFREKGRVASYQGDFDRAVLEFARALNNSRGEAAVYGALWLHIALARAGRPDPTSLQSIAVQLKPGQWPYPVVQMFLGQLSPEGVIKAAASPLASDDLMRKCEAWFYVGEKYLIDGDAGKARAAFQSSVATGVTEFLEYDWAQEELERLNATK